MSSVQFLTIEKRREWDASNPDHIYTMANHAIDMINDMAYKLNQLQDTPQVNTNQVVNILNRIGSGASSGGSGVTSNHSILSTTHDDVTVAVKSIGDLLHVSSAGRWARLPLGSANRFLVSNGITPEYRLIADSDIPATIVRTSRNLTMNGTANQINIVGGTQDLSADRTWTFSTPQDIHTGASPTFTGITLSGLTANRAVVTDGAKALASSVVTDTELGYVSGVTSSIQSQLNGKEPLISSGVASQFFSWDKTWRSVDWSYLTGVPSSFTPSSHNLLSSYHGDTVVGSPSAGDLIYANATPAWTRLPIGSAGDVLTVVGGVPVWQALSGSGITSLNGLTASTQTFADVDDTNVTLAISSVTSTHTFTMGWSGVLAESRGGTNQSSYSAGDILYASAANTLSKLPIGSAGQVLTVVGGLPAWQAASGGSHNFLSATHSDTVAGSPVAGDLIYANSTPNWTKLAVGTNGYFLKVVGGYPAWSAHGLTAGDVGAVPTSRTLTMAGTTNQISVSPTGAQDLSADRTWTFSTPQDIHTTATPTFSGLNIGSSASGASDGIIYIKNSSNYGYIGLDANEYIRFASNEWILRINNAHEFVFTNALFRPYNNNTNYIGFSSYYFYASYITTMYTNEVVRPSGTLTLTATSGNILLNPSTYVDIDCSGIYISSKSSSDYMIITPSYASSGQILTFVPSGSERWTEMEYKNTYSSTAAWGFRHIYWVNNDNTNYQRFVIAGQPSGNRVIISTDTGGSATGLALELKAGTGYWTSISANLNLRHSDTQVLKNLDFSTGTNIVLGSSYGTKIGTATTQLLGFYNASPVQQQLATTDLGTVLSNLGLRASGTAYPITTSGTVQLSGAVTLTGGVTLNSNMSGTGSILHTSTGGIGYGTGAGGTVTQTTSKSTAVTLNKICGQITTHNASLSAGAEVTFTVNNTTVASSDVVIANHVSGATSGRYGIFVTQVSAGSFQITITNLYTSALSESLIIGFAVIKAVIS